MASKTVTISSDDELEKKIKEFLKETGQSRAEFHRRASALYIGNESRKRKPKGE